MLLSLLSALPHPVGPILLSKNKKCIIRISGLLGLSQSVSDQGIEIVQPHTLIPAAGFSSHPEVSALDLLTICT